MENFPLFTFENTSDASYVSLHEKDDSFVVSVVFDAPEIGGKDSKESFATLGEASARFLALVAQEINATLSQSSESVVGRATDILVRSYDEQSDKFTLKVDSGLFDVDEVEVEGCVLPMIIGEMGEPSGFVGKTFSRPML